MIQVFIDLLKFGHQVQGGYGLQHTNIRVSMDRVMKYGASCMDIALRFFMGKKVTV